MLALLIGLLLFIGVNLIRIFAPDWRKQQIARLGMLGWKGLYATVSLIGFALMVWGYGQTRNDLALWVAPAGIGHLTALLVWIAFVLFAATYFPANHFKARLGHPMLLATKLWAFGHLLPNARPGDLLLFGGLLAWSVFAFVASRKIDKRDGVTYPAGKVGNTIMVVILGTAVWAAFSMFAHVKLIGVKPYY